jgi:peptidoglycan/LPS O-acetylase OafA/YrhL
MLFHLQERFYNGILPGFGSTPTATNPLSLPVIRIFFGGGSMVAIFFVISGYVLSTKPLKLARQGRIAELYNCVGSSTIRRGPRLYVPPLGVTFLMTLAAQAGILDGRYYGPNPNGLGPALAEWLRATSWFISPFAGKEYGIEGATWTIPLEFKGSLMVYLSCFGLAKSSTRFRLGFLIAMGLFWLWHGVWELFLFSGGMVCADIHYLHNSIPSTPPLNRPGNDTVSPPRHRRRTQLLHGFLAFASVYMLSAPEYNEGAADTPGYATLMTTLTPSNWRGGGPSRFYPATGAVILVGTMDHAGPQSMLQRVFVSNAAQYLGEISFSLYLCHGAVMHTIGNLIIPWACAALGVDYGAGIAGQGGWSYMFVLAGAMMVGLPAVFWVSDVLTEVLDKGSVKVARAVSTW